MYIYIYIYREREREYSNMIWTLTSMFQRLERLLAPDA